MSERVEVDVPSILLKDGVKSNTLFVSNQEVVNIDDILSSSPEPSWSYRVVDTDSNSATIICQNPGEGNREHYHPDWNEWWFILDGEWEWFVEGKTTRVKKGDFVLIKKGLKHKITAVGDKPAMRLAVSRSDVEHVYDV
jgi:quercetin dioxygenase-like cupin family protein